MCRYTLGTLSMAVWKSNSSFFTWARSRTPPGAAMSAQNSRHTFSTSGSRPSALAPRARSLCCLLLIYNFLPPFEIHDTRDLPLRYAELRGQGCFGNPSRSVDGADL